jgi:hypothetical protein
MASSLQSRVNYYNDVRLRIRLLHRSGILVVHVDDASKIPSLAEPWFLHFQADCKFSIAMPQRAGIEELGRKWGG